MKNHFQVATTGWDDEAAPAPKVKKPPPEKIPPPLCVWCSAPWTEDMMAVYACADVEEGYYGGVDRVAATVIIEVTCSSCKRVVYQKECCGNVDHWGDQLDRIG